MAKPPPPSAEMRQFQFGKGCNTRSEPKPGELPVLAGPVGASLNLAMADPAFGGCCWPTSAEGAPLRFCCAPARGKLCEAHRKVGVVPYPQTGRGSVVEFLRGLERYL